MSKKKDRYEFIWQAIQVHGYRDDLREVDYKGWDKKIKIICSEHGEFFISPNSYLCGNRCKKCGIISGHEKQKQTFDSFLKKAKKVHSDFYEYDELTYIDAKHKMRIICPIHGEFWQTPK